MCLALEHYPKLKQNSPWSEPYLYHLGSRKQNSKCYKVTDALTLWSPATKSKRIFKKVYRARNMWPKHKNCNGLFTVRKQSQYMGLLQIHLATMDWNGPFILSTRDAEREEGRKERKKEERKKEKGKNNIHNLWFTMPKKCSHACPLQPRGLLKHSISRLLISSGLCFPWVWEVKDWARALREKRIWKLALISSTFQRLKSPPSLWC